MSGVNRWVGLKGLGLRINGLGGVLPKLVSGGDAKDP